MRTSILLATLLLGVGCASTSSSSARGRNLAKLVHLEGDHIEVGETILFETGKANVDSASTDLLDAVADILKVTPGITKVTIEGYTDSTGDAAVNKQLSQSRADAVLAYLSGKGIAASRLEAKGFGAEQPIASNDTDEGRAKNRRVEFKVAR